MGHDQDMRLEFRIAYPSLFLNNAHTIDRPLFPVKAVRWSEEVIQTHVNALTQAHIGFITRIGDFTAEMIIYETTSRLPVMDEIRTKNLYFDLVAASLDEGGGSDWKVERTLLKGCKFATRSRRYEYGEELARTYNFNFQEVVDNEKNQDDKIYVVPLGNANVSVSIGSTTAASQSTSEKETTLQST